MRANVVLVGLRLQEFIRRLAYRDFHPSQSQSRSTYVAVPRKQLNQDFSTNMLLKIKVGIRLVLKMAPNIPQCTLKVISIQLGPPFHFNGGKNGEKGESAREKVVRSWLMFSLKLLIFTNFTSVRHMPIFWGEIIHLINISVSSNPQKVI